MSMNILRLIPRDPVIARDGRPFGAGQGNRMRGLAWPLPSVVAGSFRTVLVKANAGLDFADDMPQRLMAIEVAGVFPVDGGELYLPAPHDAVAEPNEDGKGIKTIHRVTPQPWTSDGGCNFPDDLPLQPVMLPDEVEDFKPADIPAWWPLSKYQEWLTSAARQFPSNWFSDRFLDAARQESRDHVRLDADRGAAAEGEIFTTVGLNVTHLPRFGVKHDDRSVPFDQRFAEIMLSARVTVPDAAFGHVNQLDIWHPLGGERRLVHWSNKDDAKLWECPNEVKTALADATRIRLTLATPAIFSGGWKPGWLNDGLEGSPPGTDVKLKLVGVSNGRWKAVSGWSLAKLKDQPRGPKPIRRMVPAGGVYFFEKVEGDPAALADIWLKPVSDAEQERRDGFGLAVWGTW